MNPTPPIIGLTANMFMEHRMWLHNGKYMQNKLIDFDGGAG